MTGFLFWVALAELTLCALAGWTFVALYSRVRWYASREGRHLMKFTVVVSLTYTVTLLFQAVHPKPIVQLLLSVALFGWTGFELVNRVRLHLLARREARGVPMIGRRS